MPHSKTGRATPSASAYVAIRRPRRGISSSSPDTCVPQSHTLTLRANPSPADSSHFSRGDIFAYRDYRDRRAAGFTCVSEVSRCYGLTSNSPFVG